MQLLVNKSVPGIEAMRHCTRQKHRPAPTDAYAHTKPGWPVIGASLRASVTLDRSSSSDILTFRDKANQSMYPAPL